MVVDLLKFFDVNKFMNFYEILIFMKNHLMLISIWFVLFGIVLYTTIIYWIRRGFEISCNDAIFLINKKNAGIIDMRTKDEFCSNHIINSINVSLNDIKKANVFLYEKFQDKPVIVVHSGSILLSFSIRKYLNKLGFLEVYILKGGIYDWKDHNLPLLSKK